MWNSFRNLQKELLRSGVRFYRVFLSPYFGGHCRFEPTCSTYALEALERLPLHRALAKIVRRLLSCHPLHTGGYDPVLK